MASAPEIIAASQGYETKASTEKGIESVKTNAASAAVVDLTE
ncbi:MAG: YegP family protein [Mycobacterium sp.]